MAKHDLEEMTNALLHANKKTPPGTGKAKTKLPKFGGKGKMAAGGKKKPKAGKSWM